MKKIFINKKKTLQILIQIIETEVHYKKSYAVNLIKNYLLLMSKLCSINFFLRYSHFP